MLVSTVEKLAPAISKAAILSELSEMQSNPTSSPSTPAGDQAWGFW